MRYTTPDYDNDKDEDNDNAGSQDACGAARVPRVVSIANSRA
jgi:hypothetical protein